MNNIAIIPYIWLHALQIQNVKRNVAKKATKNISDDNPNYESDDSNIQDNADSADSVSENTTNPAVQQGPSIDNITIKENPIASSNNTSTVIELSTPTL